MGGSIKGLGAPGFCILILVLKRLITTYFKECLLLIYSIFSIVVMTFFEISRSRAQNSYTTIIFFFWLINASTYDLLDRPLF